MHIHRLTSAAVVLSLFASGLPTPAEESPRSGIVVGDRVRLEWRQDRRLAASTGDVVAVDAHSISLRRNGDRDPIRVEWPVVRDVRVSRGRRASLVAMTGLGMAVGLVGLVAGCRPWMDNGASGCSGGSGGAWGGLLLGSAAGVGLGSLIKTERWQAVKKLNFAVGPQRGGVGATVSIGF